MCVLGLAMVHVLRIHSPAASTVESFLPVSVTLMHLVEDITYKEKTKRCSQVLLANSVCDTIWPRSNPCERDQRSTRSPQFRRS
eukprot:m.138597 g.138597  ORF g.138597 m.138597 type:complete len:84 (+) comp14002_c0_seq7:235-486(+)